MSQILTNPLLLGPMIALLVQVLKAIPIPFTGKTRTGLLAALTITTVLVKIGVALLSGTVHQLDLAALLPQLIDATNTLIAAAGAYSLGKKLAGG